MAGLAADGAELRGAFGELRGEIATQTRTVFLAVFTACAAVAGLVLAALAIVT